MIIICVPIPPRGQWRRPRYTHTLVLVCVCVCGSARRRTSKLARGRCARVLCTSTALLLPAGSEDGAAAGPEAAPLSRACLRYYTYRLCRCCVCVCVCVCVSRAPPLHKRRRRRCAHCGNATKIPTGAPSHAAAAHFPPPPPTRRGRLYKTGCALGSCRHSYDPYRAVNARSLQDESSLIIFLRVSVLLLLLRYCARVRKRYYFRVPFPSVSTHTSIFRIPIILNATVVSTCVQPPNSDRRTGYRCTCKCNSNSTSSSTSTRPDPNTTNNPCPGLINTER